MRLRSKKFRTLISLLTGVATLPACAGSAGEAGDADPVRVAVKFVNFTDEAGKPVLTQEQVGKLTGEMNQLYAQCNIQLVPEEYQAVRPSDVGLEYSLTSMGELDPTRKQFQDNGRLVVVNTGPWSGMGSANAWTNMPGENPPGAVIEQSAADFAGIVAHELGHYLSLGHESDPGNLLNPVIYKSSTQLTPEQCSAMRDTARSVWTAALR